MCHISSHTATVESLMDQANGREIFMKVDGNTVKNIRMDYQMGYRKKVRFIMKKNMRMEFWYSEESVAAKIYTSLHLHCVIRVRQDLKTRKFV